MICWAMIGLMVRRLTRFRPAARPGPKPLVQLRPLEVLFERDQWHCRPSGRRGSARSQWLTRWLEKRVSRPLQTEPRA
jgi:hypothetical protein